jgi:protein-tyrosine phosphatase
MADGPAPVVLVVCLGNICRSPTAEAALQHEAEARGLPLEVRSAGTGDWHLGAPPDPRMREAAAEVGLELTGEAAQVTADDLERAELILAMDRANLAALETMAARTGVTTEIRLFREFDPDARDDLEVPDPYYGGPRGFTEVLEIVRRAARGVVDHLADETT